MRDDNIHREALRRFDAEVSYLQEERALCLEDRRFAFIAGAQWEGDGWADMSENMIRVEVNKTAIGLKRIQDTYRQNRVTVNFREVKDAAQGTADLLDGLFRADVYRSKASQAFDNAFIEGSSGGMGAWLLSNELEDEFDPDCDHQRIRFDTIVDADQRVFFDGNAKLYDKSDAGWCIVLFAYTVDAFKEEFGDKISSWPEGLTKPYYDWYRPNVVMVAWYYRVEVVEEKRRTFKNAITGEVQAYWDEALADGAAEDMMLEGWVEQPVKMRKRKRVSKTILSGTEILKEKRWIAGPRIPVVPYYGQRVYIENVERVQGHVRQAKDPQRIYNTTISKLTETSALSPIERPIVSPSQIAGHEMHWAEMNINRSPYALLNPLIDQEGNEQPSGPVAYIKPPDLPPVTAAVIQQTAADIEQLTGGDDSANQVRSNVSAEAMDIAATRLDARDGSYMDNMRQSMQCTGEIYMGMAADGVYTQEGREVETMDDKGVQDSETLMKPVVTDDESYVVSNDLTQGKFMVIADVTEATATRRDKTVKACVNLAEMANGAGDQQLAQACIGTAIENMDGEGIDDLKKFNRGRMIAAGIIEPNEEERRKLAEAEQGQQPDATQVALMAQAKELEASAVLKTAQAAKAEADTALSEAKTVETYASATEKGAKATDIEHQSHERKFKMGYEMGMANDNRQAA
jgi:hypothetical protein